MKLEFAQYGLENIVKLAVMVNISFFVFSKKQNIQ